MVHLVMLVSVKQNTDGCTKLQQTIKFESLEHTSQHTFGFRLKIKNVKNDQNFRINFRHCTILEWFDCEQDHTKRHRQFTIYKNVKTDFVEASDGLIIVNLWYHNVMMSLLFGDDVDIFCQLMSIISWYFVWNFIFLLADLFGMCFWNLDCM